MRGGGGGGGGIAWDELSRVQWENEVKRRWDERRDRSTYPTYLIVFSLYLVMEWLWGDRHLWIGEEHVYMIKENRERLMKGEKWGKWVEKKKKE